MKKIKNTLQKAFPEIELSLQLDGRGILTLAGECTDWQQVVAVGHRAAKLPGVKNVVNELRVPGLAVPEKDYGPLRSRGLKRGVVADVDLLDHRGGHIRLRRGQRAGQIQARYPRCRDDR
ncbi:MAG: hypothetical protein ACOX30_04190 [Dethiobacteria bacterium]|jgi:glycerol-3-phosphate dehydrogenase